MGMERSCLTACVSSSAWLRAPIGPLCCLQGLWRGTVPGQLLTLPYTAVQFVALQQCRQAARRCGLADHPQWQQAVPFVSGALAGAAATVASYPFDLLRTTLAAQGEPPVYASMTDAGGWGVGCGRRGQARGGMQAKACMIWVSGRVSGADSACLEGVRKGPAGGACPAAPRQNSQPATRCPACPHPTPRARAARGIVGQHGVRGLYRGLGVTVLEIMPYAALQFGLYDVFSRAYSSARVRQGWGWASQKQNRLVFRLRLYRLRRGGFVVVGRRVRTLRFKAAAGVAD